MKTSINLKRFIFITLLASATLACKTMTNVLAPATPAPVTKATEPGHSPIFTTEPQPNVRACDYVPGVSVPAQMPPEVIASPTPFVYPTPAPLPVTNVDAATTEKQLSMFDQLWQIVNDRYVYTDYNGHDWNAIGNKYKTLIKKGLSDADFYTAMYDMINELGDEHSHFEDPETVKKEESTLAGQNNYVGIGALVYHLEDNTGSVLLIFPNSPAAQAGLKPHDKILGVDGGPLFDESTGRSRTLGVEGTQVTITVQRMDDQPHDITLTRAAISSPMPISYCIVPSTRIGYIFLPSFFDETIPDQMRTALEEMTRTGPLDGLIIDVRTNSGGTLGIGADILGFFTEGLNGNFVSRTAEKKPFNITAEDINGSQKVPLVILVDEPTASMGEIFSGILRVSGRAKIVGRNTLGNVEAMQAVNLDDGSRAWIAVETFEPVGESAGIWERTGIVPDVSVPTRWDLFTEANDPALAKAVELLMQK